jgi:hypothetical protein
VENDRFREESHLASRYRRESILNRETPKQQAIVFPRRRRPTHSLCWSVGTVAASVPRALTAAIRAKVGKREFSRFVGRALARELVDQNRAAYVASFEKDHGPVDPQLTARLEALFAR